MSLLSTAVDALTSLVAGQSPSTKPRDSAPEDDLQVLERQLLADDQLSGHDAKRLMAYVKDPSGVSVAARERIGGFIDRCSVEDRYAAFVGRPTTDKFESGDVRDSLKAFLGGLPRPKAGQNVVWSVRGDDPSRLADDDLYFGKPGVVSGDSGVAGFTRSYLRKSLGPLRSRHGSRAPASKLLPAKERKRANKSPVAEGLDRAAELFVGRALGFADMPSSSDFYESNAAFWVGKCHAWSWVALSRWICDRVEVEGPRGKRGVWLGGEWISRADLGNWAMALADNIAKRDLDQLSISAPTADDVLKASWFFTMSKGGGFVGDVSTAIGRGRSQTWNQPFVGGCEMETAELEPELQHQVLEVARDDGVQGAARAMRVSVESHYAKEVGDGYEDASYLLRLTWDMCAVLDANGKLLKAYLVDDTKLDGVTGLGARHTDALPDRIWKPSLDAVSAAMAGRENIVLDELDKHGERFRFFVTTVLAKGVSAQTRIAFEKKVARLGDNIPSEQAAALAQKFPGVANGYSPDQWQRVFAARGLGAHRFGAAWKS